jgi:hypothetical protein
MMQQTFENRGLLGFQYAIFGIRRVSSVLAFASGQ